jgi:magnesium-transporting ATPase (P-type)
MATVVELSEDTHIFLMKGAAERIVKRCSHYQAEDGTFADVGLATALAAFNEKALAQIRPKKKEERPALPPTQIDPVVLAALTTQPG